MDYMDLDVCCPQKATTSLLKDIISASWDR